MERKRVATLGMALLMGLPTFAVLVVDYTGAERNTPSRAADSQTPNGAVWNFSDTVYLYERAGAGITNAKIYGGLVTSWATPTNYSPLVRFNNEKVQVQVREPSLANNKATGIMVWKKTDFIAGATERLGFAPGDSLHINLLEFAGQPVRELRFVVRQDGNYYVSNTAKTRAGKGVFAIEDASAERWAKVDTTDYTYGPFGELFVDDIEAVGLFIRFERTGNAVYFSFDDFQATATVVDDTFRVKAAAVVHKSRGNAPAVNDKGRVSAKTVDPEPETIGFIF